MRKLLVLVTLLVLLFITVIPAGAAQPEATTTTWKYTALGDSLAVGVGSSSCILAIFNCNGYVPRYKNAVQTGASASISLTNLGQSGWTSANLLSALNSNTTFINNVKASQVITIDIGGNDLKNARQSYKAKTCGGTDNQNCLRTAVTTFKNNWSAILARVIALRTVNKTLTPTVIRTMDLYNPYVAADKAANTWADNTETGPYAGNDFAVFKAYLKDVNNYIATTSTANNIPYAKVHDQFNGSDDSLDPVANHLIYSDGLHANDAGYQIIATQLNALGYAPLK